MDEPLEHLPIETLARLSSIAITGASLNAVLDKLAHIAWETVPGADAVSITLLRTDRGFTAAYTSQLALDVDEAQYRADHGPCLEAARGGVLIEIAAMPTETRWPTYARRAEKAGILSSLSVPLPIQTDLIGALNVYSERTAAFRPAGRNLAERLASFVAVACANAEAYSTAVEFGAQMQAAMATRAVIEQAKGIFMAENRCSPEAAFEILRSRSMAVNVKLRDVAQQVVACVYGVEAPGLP